MSDQQKPDPREIESLNQENLDVENMSPEDLEQVSGGYHSDCPLLLTCGTFSQN